MAEKSQEGLFSFTAPVAFIWPALFEPRKFGKKGQEKGEPKYSSTILFPPDHPDFTAMKQRALAVAKLRWPGRDIAADYKARELRMPWKTGDSELDRFVKKLTNDGKTYDGSRDFLKGSVVLKATSKFQPRLSVIANGKIVDLEEGSFAAHKSKFYSGVEGLAQINLVTYNAIDENAKDGVTAYLNLVLTLGKGAKRGGGTGPVASEVFKGYVGTSTEEDPTGGLDDEIPF